MKILILSDNMNNGGAETHVYELAKHLSQKGHDVVVLSNGGKIANQLSSLGIRQKFYGDYPLLTLASLIRTEHPDIVHAHTRRSVFFCRLLSTFFCFPFVFTAHAIFSDKQPKKQLTCFSLPSYTIAVGTDIAEHLVNHFGLSRRRITIIPNGIDIQRFCPSKDKIFHPHTILTISRLDKDCSVTARLLCKLAPFLQNIYRDLRIIIVGGGDDFTKVSQLATKANAISGRHVVSIAGTQSDVLPYLQTAGIFVGVSRAALEAMACRVPVILCGNEGYLGIADRKILPIAEKSNYCARGTKSATPKKLFLDLCKLLQDTNYADQVANDGLKQVLHYHTAERMTKDTLTVYRAAIRNANHERQSDILLCGYYGYGNIGDELTLRSIQLQLKKQGVQHLAVLAKPGKQYESMICINRFNPIDVIHAIRHTGLLLFGGGSLLQNKTSNRSLLYYLTLLRLASLVGVPTMLYACGIGPIRGVFMNRLVIQSLKNTNLITVRDPDSLRYLEKIGDSVPLYLSSDPVLFCRLPECAKNGYVVAFVRQEEVDRFVAFLSKQPKPIYVAMMDQNADALAALALVTRLQNKGLRVRLVTGLSIRQTASLIAGADLVVSARLHALILAFCANVPFIGLSTDPKITSFQHSIHNTRNFVSHETLLKEMKGLAQKDPLLAAQIFRREL